MMVMIMMMTADAFEFMYNRKQTILHEKKQPLVEAQRAAILFEALVPVV